MYYVIFILAALGGVVSVYAYSVEQHFRRNAQFNPLCDISDFVSCSKAFTSQYNSLFGVSNSLAGLAFYVGMMILAVLQYGQLIFLGALASVGMSIIFAYFLYVKIKSVCVVCTSVHIINILLLVVSWYNLR